MLSRALRSFRSVRLSLVREKTEAPYVRQSDCVASMARAILADDPREGLLAFYLDNRHRVMAVHRVSVGTCEATVVAPREVFCPAVALSAQCIVVAHNHPSGDATPSGEDRMVTERLKRAGDILGIEVLDHLVLGAERYFTFAEETFRAYPVTA